MSAVGVSTGDLSALLSLQVQKIALYFENIDFPPNERDSQVEVV